MSEENEDTTGYVLASDYAQEVLEGVDHVIQQLRDGELEGRLINERWYVKVDAKMAEKVAGKPKSNPLGQTAQTRYVAQATTKVRTVQVTGISIPFGDVLMVPFQFAVASILVGLIPIALLLVVITS